MFWGKGDSSKLDADAATTLHQLRRMEETGHIVALSPEQTQVAIRAVSFYQQWESVLTLFTSFKNVALLVGALLAIYWATEGWFIEAVRNAIGGAP